MYAATPGRPRSALLTLDHARCLHREALSSSPAGAFGRCENKFVPTVGMRTLNPLHLMNEFKNKGGGAASPRHDFGCRRRGSHRLRTERGHSAKATSSRRASGTATAAVPGACPLRGRYGQIRADRAGVTRAPGQGRLGDRWWAAHRATASQPAPRGRRKPPFGPLEAPLQVIAGPLTSQAAVLGVRGLGR